MKLEMVIGMKNKILIGIIVLGLFSIEKFENSHKRLFS